MKIIIRHEQWRSLCLYGLFPIQDMNERFLYGRYTAERKG